MPHPKLKDLLFGIAIGDALGVPVEFKSRTILQQQPVTDMIGFGTHNQPPGTWSDDSSLTFCLVESLKRATDLTDLANRFINWYEHAYWTAHGDRFDVGNATAKAIYKLKTGVEPTKAGGTDEYSNGNGSLMRILPLAFYVQDLSLKQRFQRVRDISALTHGHIRSVFACFIAIELTINLIKGMETSSAFDKMQNALVDFTSKTSWIPEKECSLFHRLLYLNSEAWKQIPESEIASSGYVIHTLEASIWCLLTTNAYKDAVLKAVNLGDDSDTTGAVTGGFAGLLYGFDALPASWVEALALKQEIERLATS